jgi:hypothetical protein
MESFVNKSLVTILAISGVLTASPCSAGIGVEANGTRADGHWGGELGVGYAFGVAGFKVTPAVGILAYHRNNGRYYLDDNDEDEACRHGNTGRYADRELCNDTTIKPYGRVEATYSIPLLATVGAGVRVGRDVRPYGTVAMPLLAKLRLKGNAGPHYYAAGLTLGF